MNLERLTWLDVQQLDLSKLVVILPLGAVEQHGHHLPLMTDTAIITAITQRLELQRPELVLTLPALWVGHSTHHLHFPGTVSITQQNYQAAVCDMVSSLVQAGARKIFLLNGHGGNDLPVRYALRELKSRHIGIANLRIVFASYWHLAGPAMAGIRESGPGGMGHACEMETSLMLLLHPDTVRLDRIRRDGPRQSPPYRVADMLLGSPVYEVAEFHEISETGTVGHPDLASAEKGERFMEVIVEAVSAFVDDFQTWGPIQEH